MGTPVGCVGLLVVGQKVGMLVGIPVGVFDTVGWKEGCPEGVAGTKVGSLEGMPVGWVAVTTLRKISKPVKWSKRRPQAETRMVGLLL